MSDIKYSQLLETIWQEAVALTPDRKEPTVEGFLSVVIDRVIRSAKYLENTDYRQWFEHSRLVSVLNPYKGGLEKARGELLKTIAEGKAVSLSESASLKRAADLVGSDKPVDSVILLRCILEAYPNMLQADTEEKPEVSKPFDMSSLTEQLRNSGVKLPKKEAEKEKPVEPQPVAEKPVEPQPVAEKPKSVSAQVGNKTQVNTLVTDVKQIVQKLRSVIFGQDHAIDVFAAGYFQSVMRTLGQSARKQPLATFLFAGPPGVGKTFLAETAADVLDRPFKRFDMSEYGGGDAITEFAGSDRSYGGKPGNVTGFVAKNPKCVILFDEIEKASLGVIHLFLQILDAGFARDLNTDQQVSFKDAVLIFTTNAGKKVYEEAESDDLSNISKKVIMKALQQEINPRTGSPMFPAAICSRFATGNVVMFNHVGANTLLSITKKEFCRNTQLLEKEMGIQMKAEDPVFTALLLEQGGKADGRTVKSRAESFYNQELYELLRLINSEKVATQITQLEDITVKVDLAGASEEVIGLFRPLDKPHVLVLASGETVEFCKGSLTQYQVHGAVTSEAAIEIMQKEPVDFLLLDMQYDTRDANFLNIEDVESPARSLVHFLREKHVGMPTYLLETNGAKLSPEEVSSFLSQGIRGVVTCAEAEAFETDISKIAEALHQQAGMDRLARSNKVLSFETAQTVSEDGKCAQVRLFDFGLKVAVDSEDSGSILSALSKPNVRFEDVIGAEDAKQELKSMVGYLKNPRQFMGTGIKAPKGILLYGPPGTGKTLLAKALACEADVTFLAAEGNQFLKKYVGEGPETVHELFRTARKYAPAVLFIDEIDAIGRARDGSENNSPGVDATLTALLTEMDGFTTDPSKPVFVLAATNFNIAPGSGKYLDGALVRRFERRMYIDRPGKEDRIRFLRQSIRRNKALAISEEQLQNIAVRSTGMSLAELTAVVELALRSAIRSGSTVVTDSIFEEAFETYNNGEVKHWDASQLERVARHEAGHALLYYLAGETPSYVTIVARGNHGGYMQHDDKEGKAIYTKEELLGRIRTSLGGRAAEILYYGEQDGISTGASGDLANATNIARSLVCSYGMDDTFGLAVVDAHAASGPLSVQLRQTINQILEEQMAASIRLLQTHRDQLNALVDALLRKNSLTQAQILQVLSGEDHP